MALRRSVSGVAAMSMGLSAQLDVAHTTVIKYEIRLRAAQVASMQSFFVRHCKERELAAATEPGMRIRLHGIRADATNSNVIRRNKLKVALVNHVFLSGLVEGASFADWKKYGTHGKRNH